MKCDFCEVNEADMYLDYLISDAGERVLLCTSCASLLPLEKKEKASSDIHSERVNIICPGCFTSRNTLLQSGRAGCVHCYDTFREEIKLIRDQNRIINEPVRN